ncbi:chorismate pyruvate-lyase family protein [Aquibacillus albus]|uniref:Chorismate-pyruvate lyase n=1 Tax=Aquibacillus albus TaxID=1168171 RepID=A0ABS2N2M0_9BACI|nr:chorismate pyruvate-lyase family protein [Aquibacillus albus]MBM7572341.1 chorismate-pyruvate lyase [Aquibacillus albus]
MKDSQFEHKALKVLKTFLLDLLLVTDGRTTDFLEVLLNEKLKVQVIRQEQINEADAKLFGESSGAPYYIRESVLIGERSGFVVSHNIAMVYAKHVPPALFESIAHQKYGIGNAISSLGMRSFRKVTDSGYVNEEESVDLFQQPIRLHFSDLHEKVPYKRYDLYFGSKPGIEMLEYYHPSIIEHRLLQEISKEQSSN